MARTKEQIKQSIEDKVNTYPELAELQSNTSRVSYWRYLKDVIAFVTYYLELLLDRLKVEIEGLIDTTESGSLPWYKSQIEAFQYGDALTIIDNRPRYSTTNPDKRIIKRVAIQTGANNKGLVIKVVKEQAGTLVPLDEYELAALTVYINHIKIAGTSTQVESKSADQMTIKATIRLDKQLYNQHGQLVADTNQRPVEEAIDGYLRDFGFGSTFYLSELVQVVMQIEGVVAFHVSECKLGAEDVQTLGYAESEAGHIQRDTNTSTLTYELH